MIFPARITHIPILFALLSGVAFGDTTTFSDDFEVGADSENEWFQEGSFDTLWTVVDDGPGNGVFRGDATNSTEAIAATANRLGCSSVDGYSLYRNTTQSYSYDVKLEPGAIPTAVAAASFILADTTHPSLLPVAGTYISYDPNNNGTAIGIFQDDDFSGAAGNFQTTAEFFPLSAFDPFVMHRVSVTLSNNTLFMTVEGSPGVVISSQSWALLPLVVPPFMNRQQGHTGLGVAEGGAAVFDNFSLTGDEICLDNTPAGGDVEVDLIQGATATFENVTTEGSTVIVRSEEPPEGSPPTSTAFQFNGEYFDVTTTAEFSGEVELCFTYSDDGLSLTEEENLKLLHFNEIDVLWEDTTTTLPPIDTVNNIICGTTTQFSVFAVSLPDSDNDDICDGDMYLVGVCEAGPDNCRTIPNYDQLDDDGNECGNACEFSGCFGIQCAN